MKLTLEVISSNGSSLGAERRKVFGPGGGRIGRADDCDWVLPSPDRYVSRHHATIICKFGQFYVKAEGRNEIAINSRNALLPFDTPGPLNQGDRLYIDEYEILASVAKEVLRPTSIIDDPFAEEPAPVSRDLIRESGNQESLDPLSRLPMAPARSGTGEGYSGVPQGDILSDAFTPPAPPFGRGQPGNSTSIPTDPAAWNKTAFGLTTIQTPEQPPVRPPIKPVVTPAARERAAQKPQPAPPPRPAPVSPRPPPNRAADTQPPPRRMPQSGPPDGISIGGFDMNAMLRAAGVDPKEVSTEDAAMLGQILLVVVQGTIDALRAREEVKSQFRLAVTRLRVKENNPLAFATDAADAINSLLSRRNPAFLPPLEAFKRAFDDTRTHQLAMLAGMRAGFESLMARFDPEQLQEDFDRQVKRSGKLGVGKPRYWDLYADYFAGLRGDREDAFRRLFGEEFAVAYEKQVELIKRSRGDKNS